MAGEIHVPGTLTADGDFPVVDISSLPEATPSVDGIMTAEQADELAANTLALVSVTHFYTTCASVRSTGDHTLTPYLFVSRRMFVWDGTSTATDDGTETTSAIAQTGVATGRWLYTSEITFVDFADLSDVAAPVYREGRTYYADNSLNVMTEFSDVTIQLGEESQLQVYADNADILNGQAVYAYSAQGKRLAVRKASTALDDTYANRVIGLATHDIDTHENGRATTFGLVRGLNTNALTVGQCLYTSDTDGVLTTTVPPGDKNGARVALVVEKHPTDGSLFVYPEILQRLAGTTANRPTTPRTGQAYFDTSLGREFWWNGTVWIDADRSYYETNWAVTDWYVDNVNGNDSNAGTSSGTALASLEELTARLAVPMPCNHSVTVHIAYSATSYGTLAVQFIQGAAGAYFDVIGAPSYTSIGTITSYADRVAASNYEPRLVCSGVADWTSYVGKRIDVTDGASSGAICWVGKVSPQSVGVGTAGVTRFAKRNTTTASFTPLAESPANGSSVSVAALPAVSVIQIMCASRLISGITEAAVKGSRPCSVRDLQCDIISIDSSGYVDGCSCATMRFGIRNSNTWSKFTRGLFTFLEIPSAGVYSTALYSVIAQYCLFRLSNAVIVDSSIQESLGYAATFFGDSTSWYQNSGFFDNSGSPISVAGGTGDDRIFVSGCYGNGNSRGVSVSSACTMQATGNYVTGSSGDVRVNATHIPWSALPWTDGERSGEATLAVPAPGTHEAEATSYVDVTVPYVLSTQKIMVGYKTFAGTTGQILGKYVSATSIRIVSSSALDTSVVTWHILPVGDNCVIRS